MGSFFPGAEPMADSCRFSVASIPGQFGGDGTTQQLPCSASDNQRKLAVQARVASTYEDMLEMVGWQMEVVDATKPIFTMGKPPEPPPQPENRGGNRALGAAGPLH